MGSKKKATTKLTQHPDPKKLQELWDAIVRWRDEHEVSCAESLLQVDSVNEELPELAEAALDIVGYWEE